MRAARDRFATKVRKQQPQPITGAVNFVRPFTLKLADLGPREHANKNSLAGRSELNHGRVEKEASAAPEKVQLQQIPSRACDANDIMINYFRI